MDEIGKNDGRQGFFRGPTQEVLSSYLYSSSLIAFFEQGYNPSPRLPRLYTMGSQRTDEGSAFAAIWLMAGSQDHEENFGGAVNSTTPRTRFVLADAGTHHCPSQKKGW